MKMSKQPGASAPTLRVYFGRALLLGLFLVLSAALLPICVIYSFVWIAQV